MVRRLLRAWEVHTLLRTLTSSELATMLVNTQPPTPGKLRSWEIKLCTVYRFTYHAASMSSHSSGGSLSIWLGRGGR